MTRRLRVCLDLTPLEMLDRHGGIGRYGLRLLEHFASMSQAALGPLEMWAALRSDQRPAPAAEALARVRHLPKEIPSWRHKLQRRLFLGPLLSMQRIALFHSIVPYFAPTVTTSKQIATVHDVIPVVMPEHPGLWQKKQWLRHRWHFASFSHYVADTERTRQDMITGLGISPSRVTTVHLGVDTETFRRRSESDSAALLRRTDLPEKFFVCVSSDHYRKNHKLLFDAWCKVASDVPAGLVFVGKQLYRSTFDEIRTEVSRRGLGGRFRWYSDVEDAELPSIYQRATAAVAPSRYEGFGLTVLEAMACGTPVIAAQNGAYDEVAGGAAELFAPSDRPRLEELLRALSGDPVRRESLASRGLARAGELSWRACAERNLAVYRKVLGV